MQNYYAQILGKLAEAGVDFVVGGGVAVVLHGVERMTIDIDLAVDMDPENLKRFIGVMEELSLSPRVPVPATFLCDAANRRMMIEEKNALVFSFIDPNNPLKHVDVFLRDDHAYECLIEDAETMCIGDETINVISRKRLLAIKENIAPPRPKDLYDISELRRIESEEAAE